MPIEAPAGAQVFRCPGWQTTLELVGGLAIAAASAVLAMHPEFRKMGLVLMPCAAYALIAFAYERRWMLTLDDQGVTLMRLTGTTRLAWSDVAGVALQGTASLLNRQPLLAVRAKPGGGKWSIRFAPSRLSQADRRRLSLAFAERGHPLELM